MNYLGEIRFLNMHIDAHILEIDARVYFFPIIYCFFENFPVIQLTKNTHVTLIGFHGGNISGVVNFFLIYFFEFNDILRLRNGDRLRLK